VLVDDEFLVAGSQNFRYSAYGDSGLTEFNIAIDDSQALFEYYWEQGTLMDMP